MTLHDLAQKRSLAYHQAVARRLLDEPALIEQARERLAAWISEGGRAAPLARRWTEILDRPLPEVVAFLESDNDEARQLRQATPFAGFLSPQQRWRLWEEVRLQHEGR